jgi:hypothetical protein
MCDALTHAVSHSATTLGNGVLRVHRNKFRLHNTLESVREQYQYVPCLAAPRCGFHLYGDYGKFGGAG